MNRIPFLQKFAQHAQGVSGDSAIFQHSNWQLPSLGLPKAARSSILGYYCLVKYYELLTYNLTLHDVSAVYRGCAVHQGMFSTLKGYHWIHRGVFSTMGVSWVHRGILWAQWGEYHEHSGGISWAQQGILWWAWEDIIRTPKDVQYTGVPMQIQLFPNDLPPHLSWYPPVYWPPPVYSWYPSLYSRYPPVYWTSPVVLHTPGLLHRDYAGRFCLAALISFRSRGWSC